MGKVQTRILMLMGIMLIVLGGFGWGYTYMVDHRSAASLSAYCNIDFQTDVDEEGYISTATLTMVDYRYNGAELKKNIELICDGEIYPVEGVTKQTNPTYAILFYNPRTTFMNTNKFFAELPMETFKPMRKAKEIRVRMLYDNGDIIDLPLDDHDLAYWQEHLQDRVVETKKEEKKVEEKVATGNKKKRK